MRIDGALYPGIDWDPADKAPGSRKQGWEQLRQRLANAYRRGHEPREYPGLFIVRGRCPTSCAPCRPCLVTIRTSTTKTTSPTKSATA